MADAAVADRNDRWFFGHPKGLAYLAFTEAWERFSYYGMIALLVLYMTKQLLLPGHIENVVGMGAMRWLMEHTYGGGKPMTVVALASAIYGTYASAVYLTPFFGGLLADHVLGRTRTVVLGACLMAAGHFLMAFDQSFLGALSCLLLGAGCLKGNLATQVGELYGPQDTRRADAFQIYYIGINGGVIFGPTVTSFLGQEVAWHYGFGAAGIGMLLSLVIYISGRRFLPADTRSKRAAQTKAPRAPMSGRDRRILILLMLLLPVLSLSIVGNNQIQNGLLIWADRDLALPVIFGKPIPAGTLIAVDSIVSVTFIFGMVMFWRWWKTRFKEPDEIGKIVIGCFFGAAGVLCLAAGSAIGAATGEKVSFFWLLAFLILNDIGFANVLPVGLAFYARAAPAALAGSIIGLYYLHLMAGNALVGYLGGLLEKMPTPQFWLLHAALVATAGVVFLVVRLVFRGLLAGPPAQPDFVAADAGETP